jgi:hypothetical protein
VTTGRLIGQVDLVRPVLVGVPPELLAVQVEGGDGVQTVADQPQPLVGREVVGELDRGTEPPVPLLDPADPGLVAVDVRVPDPAGRQQALVHPARHDRRQPLGVRSRLDPYCGAGQLEPMDRGVDR